MRHVLPLAGIKLSKEAAVELVKRMNENWPGEYVLFWEDAPYSNGMLNPFRPVYSGASALRQGESR